MEPATLVGKFPSPSEESRAAGARGGYRSETLFYTELAENLPIRTPECLYGAISGDHKTFTLLLEDLAPAQQGDQIGGGSNPPEQRREHESHMLEVYRESMAELGIERSADEVYADYVYGSFQGPSITMLVDLFVGQTDRGDEMFMAMAHRATAQIHNLDALDLLA